MFNMDQKHYQGNMEEDLYGEENILKRLRVPWVMKRCGIAATRGQGGDLEVDARRFFGPETLRNWRSNGPVFVSESVCLSQICGTNFGESFVLLVQNDFYRP